MVLVNLKIKQWIYLFFCSAFLALWLVFMIRENKWGEYGELLYLYTHNDTEKRRFVMGEAQYDFLEFCQNVMPPGSTYNIVGLEDINLLRAKYMLWPARFELRNPDFILVFKSHYVAPKAYPARKTFQDKGFILIKKDSL